MDYYNDNDKFSVKWLKSLIKDKLIPEGIVDDRSIKDIRPSDLRGFTQCHFFAGIGGWPYALKLAGWPRDRQVWTGSCPCQPFSNAGKGGGVNDERHLWPAFRWLIAQCKPTIVFGEQVASKLGRQWFAGVRSDLETLGYAVGAADLCAAGVGAPHIRQRLFWVADSGREGLQERECVRSISGGSPPPKPWQAFELASFTDGKVRRIPAESAFFPLDDGLSTGRVGALRGAGNAIVPQVAAEFIKAFLVENPKNHIP